LGDRENKSPGSGVPRGTNAVKLAEKGQWGNCYEEIGGNPTRWTHEITLEVPHRGRDSSKTLEPRR